jgi:hypothetical protein
VVFIRLFSGLIEDLFIPENQPKAIYAIGLFILDGMPKST